MSNYKLTTDLIKDCMALIPQNLEVLAQKASKAEKQNLDLFIYPNLLFTGNQKEWGLLEENEKFAFISHCLRTIPEFQVENAEYRAIKKEEKSCDNIQRIHHIVLTNCQKTIWQATLHGNGTFPSTLEELCESYKNVMSK